MKVLDKIKKISWQTWMLVIIILVGIFLRTWQFHSWLEFRGDQVRDAYRTDQVVKGEMSWPLLGPHLNHSGVTEDESFHVGPIYYYFQILSAEIFGSYPDKLAYPDVFFAILSIPLLYFFLKEYFSQNIALGVTGIYSISAYVIRYSRYAWSCNPIPFFVLLFLLSLSKLLDKNEKTHWGWVVALGVSWGVGFQLHAITMIIFSTVAFLAFLFSMKQNRKVWGKWAMVLLIFFILNFSQIVSEMRTNFKNTKSFLNFFSAQDTLNNPSGVPVNVKKNTFLGLVANDTGCHIEANSLYLSSYGTTLDRSNCQGDFLKMFSSTDNEKKHAKKFKFKIGDVILWASLLFSLGGYFLLLFYNKKEKDRRKKYFLHLVVVYLALSYLLMLPLSNGGFNDLRYFSFLFFTPFLMLGFWAKFLWETIKKKYAIMLVLLLFFLFGYSNIVAISYRASMLANKKGMSSGTAILGETEDVVNYMIAHSNGKNKIYLGGDHPLLAHSFDAMQYLADKRGIELIRFEDRNNLSSNNNPAFYMDNRLNKNFALDYHKIGDSYIYQIKN